MWWVVVTMIAVGGMLAYGALLNGMLLRCPYCRSMGSWRFDPIAPAVEQFDDNGNLVRSAQQRRCRRCGGEVEHVWSDYEGRTMRKIDG